jgi:hypothetical protein
MRKYCNRIVFPFLSILLITSPLCGADNPEWNNLKQLSPGQKVRIKLNDGKLSKGDFQSVSDDAIVIRANAADQTFQRSGVKKVSSRRSGHRARHALIGAAIGAGVGLGTGAAIDNDCTSQDFICTGNKGKAILTPVFALVGAGIGALLPAGGWQEVYRER